MGASNHSSPWSKNSRSRSVLRISSAVAHIVSVTSSGSGESSPSGALRSSGQALPDMMLTTLVPQDHSHFLWACPDSRFFLELANGALKGVLSHSSPTCGRRPEAGSHFQRESTDVAATRVTECDNSARRGCGSAVSPAPSRCRGTHVGSLPIRSQAGHDMAEDPAAIFMLGTVPGHCHRPVQQKRS